jgi:hypothetical protein
LVNLSSGNVVIPRQRYVEVSLIVSEIEIGLSTVVQHIDLTWNKQVIHSQDTLQNRSHIIPNAPCSVGAIVPASMFMYGSILIEVTFNPVVLSKRPVDEAFTTPLATDGYLPIL